MSRNPSLQEAALLRVPLPLSPFSAIRDQGHGRCAGLSRRNWPGPPGGASVPRPPEAQGRAPPPTPSPCDPPPGGAGGTHSPSPAPHWGPRPISKGTGLSPAEGVLLAPHPYFLVGSSRKGVDPERRPLHHSRPDARSTSHTASGWQRLWGRRGHLPTFCRVVGTSTALGGPGVRFLTKSWAGGTGHLIRDISGF